MMMDVAPAARMMLRVLIPAGVQKPQIQMIGDMLQGRDCEFRMLVPGMIGPAGSLRPRVLGEASPESEQLL
jgi:hypothetical protein